MRWTRRLWLTLAMFSGFIAVGAGAFAAHGLTGQSAELMRTGATYELTHALATIGCAVLTQLGATRARLAPALFLGGSVLLSGSLYALALGAPRLIGVVTPFGGLLLLGGWATLAWSAAGIDRDQAAG